MKFIDAHTHLHAHPYNEWELLGMAGMEACVISAGNPYIYRESFQEAPGLDTIRRLWDHPIGMAEMVRTQHFIECYTMVGISSMTRVADLDDLLGVLPDYLRHERVVALGEVGLDPVQYFGLDWPLDEQKAMLLEQLRVATKERLPVVLHTPMWKGKRHFGSLVGDKEGGGKDARKQEFLEMDLDLVARSGLEERKLIIDHADRSIIPHVLENTNAYLGISIAAHLRRITPQDVAEIVSEYGPDRIILNSDIGSYISYDLLSIPKAIREMRRAGIDPDSIKRVVYTNARDIFNLEVHGG